MATDPSLLFGTIALQSGRLTKESLDSVLEEQLRSPAPLGEICRRRGLLTANQVRRILKIQRDGALAASETRLGALAVKNGFVGEQELGSVLDRHKDAARRLGEILLEEGTLTAQALKALLAAQNRLRGAEAPTDEVDSETREIAAVPSTPGSADEPQAWLIQEMPGMRPETFPVGRVATLGRLPSLEVPVPDMGSSRQHARLEYSPHIRRHVLSDLDSRNGTFVNGERISQPCPLSPGDLIQIGDVVFRYAVGPGFSSGEAPPAAPVETSAGPAQPAWRRAWTAVRRGIDRVAPGIHPQRRLFVVAAWLGMIATFLPWTHRADGTTSLGVPGLGLAVLPLFAVVAVFSLLGDRSQPPSGKMLAGMLASAGTAGLIGIIRLLVLARTPAASGRIGLYLASLIGTALALAIWLRRDGKSGAALPDPKALWGSVRSAAALASGTTVKLFKKSASGNKAHEKAIVFRKRSDLLKQIGDAARRAGIACAETDSVVRAEREVGESRKQVEGLPAGSLPKDSIMARHELKNAELRLERSLQELGRSVIARGVPLEEERARIAEVLLLDQRVKDLG